MLVPMNYGSGSSAFDEEIGQAMNISNLQSSGTRGSGSGYSRSAGRVKRGGTGGRDKIPARCKNGRSDAELQDHTDRDANFLRHPGLPLVFLLQDTECGYYNTSLKKGAL